MRHDGIIDGHILNIVQTHPVFEQSDLQKILHDRGYEIPQATLSRRLKKLNIAKVAGRYKIVDFNPPHLPIILHLQVSDFGLIVLHTHPGNANNLAYFFDQKYVADATQKNSGILGTIAGDDTVLLITKSKDDVEQAIALIREEFSYLPHALQNTR